MSNFARWKNILKFIRCRYNSIPLHNTLSLILGLRQMHFFLYNQMLFKKCVWPSLEFRAKIYKKFRCFFWNIWKQKKNLQRLTDLYLNQKFFYVISIYFFIPKYVTLQEHFINEFSNSRDPLQFISKKGTMKFVLSSLFIFTFLSGKYDLFIFHSFWYHLKPCLF